MTSAADAVVVGAGPNGLVAANLLADAGWDVLVLEAQDEPGGAVRTAEVTAPAFRNDLYSAPQSCTGLLTPPPPASRPTLPGTARRGCGCSPAGSGRARPCCGPSSPRSPRSSPGSERWARIGPRGVLPLARFLVLPVRRLVEEEFRGASAGLLLGGNAMHTDVPPDAPPSGFLGWLLASLGQDVGFPSPVGGAGELTAALVRRFRGAGGRIECGARVDRIVLEGGRAVGVEVAGSLVRALRAVLADVDADVLYRRLVGAEHLPAATLAALDRFQRSWATVKVDWALHTPIPWNDPSVGTAGTVHLAASIDELAVMAAAVSGSRIPKRSVRRARPDDHDRPDPLARRHRIGVGVHPRARPGA